MDVMTTLSRFCRGSVSLSLSLSVLSFSVLLILVIGIACPLILSIAISLHLSLRLPLSSLASPPLRSFFLHLSLSPCLRRILSFYLSL